MNTSIEIEAMNIRDRLLYALWQLDCYPTEWVDGKLHIYEPECHGLYYTADHRFAIVAVGSDQFRPDRSVEFLNRRKSQAVLKAILGRNVETIVENSVIYFRILVHQVVERIAA